MRYYLYFFQRYRIVLIFMIMGIASLISVIVIGMHTLANNKPVPPQIATNLNVTSPARQSEILLRSLSAASLDIAELLHREADNMDITLEEVSYEIRREQNLPVVLRNARFTLTNTYTTIRQYLDRVLHAQTNLTLDALDCTRDDIASREVNCAITISAVQRFNPISIENIHVN